jgi:hypothetical protein
MGTNMAQWERKQVGAIVQAATAHIDREQDPAGRSRLATIVQFGKTVERSDFTGGNTLPALRAALCAYCNNGKIYPCAGYVQGNGCAFVEAEVTMTPSCFGDFA